MKECIPNKRKILDNDTNKKKVSLSLRRTRLKKECQPEINSLNIINHDEKKFDIHMKQEIKEESPFQSSFNSDLNDIKQEFKAEDNAYLNNIQQKFKIEDDTYLNDFKQEYKLEVNNNVHNIKEEYKPGVNTDVDNITQEFKLEDVKEFTTQLKQEQNTQFPMKQESEQEDVCSCIICGKDMNHFDIRQRQQHVNDCLDMNQSNTVDLNQSSVVDMNPFSTVETLSQDDDFSNHHIISNINNLWKPKKEDVNDEYYQTTLALSKSLHKPDKKVKIELNEANIWSNEESRAEASNKLFDMFEISEKQLIQQLEREKSIGYMKPSQFYTTNSYWELASLSDCSPTLFTCLFLSKLHQ